MRLLLRKHTPIAWSRDATGLRKLYPGSALWVVETPIGEIKIGTLWDGAPWSVMIHTDSEAAPSALLRRLDLDDAHARTRRELCEIIECGIDRALSEGALTPHPLYPERLTCCSSR